MSMRIIILDSFQVQIAIYRDLTGFPPAGGDVTALHSDLCTRSTVSALAVRTSPEVGVGEGGEWEGGEGKVYGSS